MLVVDDDPALLRALRVGLTALGHEIVTASNGQQGISQAALSPPDVVVLDLGLPDLDGLEVCRRIRQWSHVPILVLSATDAEGRKVAALDLGADDYVTKPFGMAELDARLRAALRRVPPAPAAPTELAVGDVEIDMVHHQAHRAGRPLELTSREFGLLAFLARNAPKVCTHRMILEGVWGPGYGTDTGHLRVYVHRLRHKLGDEEGRLLRSAPGIGYSLAPADPGGPAPDG